MLRAIRRLLRPGGRTAFTTIHVTPGLSPAQRRRAHRAGPRAVASRREHTDLLRSAGFVDVVETDVTSEFLETARAWIDECDTHAAELAAAEGAAAFEQRQRDRRRQLAGIEEGLLRRVILSATRPPR